MTEKKSYEGSYEGAKKVTCTEATNLLKEDQVVKAWFRPDGIINYVDPDNDPAYVWLKDHKNDV